MRRFVLVALVALLAACGTGDTGAAGEAPDVTPSVIQATPTGGVPGAADTPSSAPSDEADGVGLADFEAAVAPLTDPPATVIVFAEPNRLEVWDTESARVLRVLTEYDDPDGFGSADEPEAAGLYLDDVRLLPDGSGVVYSTCCEPAVGAIQVFAFPDGPSEFYAYGDEPAFAWDGSLVRRTLGWVTFGREDAGTQIGERDEEPDAAPIQLAWSPDAHTLAGVWQVWDVDGRVSSSEVVVFDRDTTTFDEARVLRPPEGRVWVAPAFRRDGMLVVAEQAADGTGEARGLVLDPGSGDLLAEFTYPSRVSTQRYDASHTFLLVVGEDGSLSWQGLGMTGTIASSGVLDAAW